VTSLICWATYKAGQAFAPNSIYIASDSRITWATPKKYWDGARKVFTCRVEAHMFGYCGDVVFPSLVIAQLVSAIDNGVLFPSRASAQDRHEFVYNSLQKSFRRRSDVPDQDFSILHALRMGEDEKRKFSIWEISYDSKRKEWNTAPLPIPTTTDIVAIFGSGEATIKRGSSWN
jgi:hypothetical protein